MSSRPSRHTASSGSGSNKAKSASSTISSRSSKKSASSATPQRSASRKRDSDADQDEQEEEQDTSNKSRRNRNDATGREVDSTDDAESISAATATSASSSSASSSSSSITLLEHCFNFLDSDSSMHQRSLISPSTFLLFLLILFALLIRYQVSGGSYSGMNKAPMYGDYEAQRHWMEVTLTLPIREWYEPSERNDLLYWGLDYPPLTAYVSYAFGLLARLVGEGGLVEETKSRGYETESSKYFMRMTVMLCDLVAFLPAILLALRAIYPASLLTRIAPSRVQSSYASHISLITFLLLISPTFILIDHGHFQYNCVSLGLVVFSIYFIWKGRDLLAAIMFVLSMCFKQMSLYYAPAFFAYLLARCLVGKGNGTEQRRVSFSTTLIRLAILGTVVIATFLLMFSPWLHSLSSITQTLHRIFPFARGLYEDKVANVWCATSLFIKWHLWFEKTLMVRCSLICTVLSFLPSCLHVFLHPSRKSFLYTLASGAFSFYLFSFQVHEKTILLPMLPVSLLIGVHPLLVTWSTLIANFSMYPLLEKDGHTLSYFVLQAFFAVCAMAYAKSRVEERIVRYGQPASKVAARIVDAVNQHPLLQYRLVQLSLLVASVLHLLWFFLPIPPRYPDLLTMMFVIYAAAHFVLFYLILLVQQWTIPLAKTEDEALQNVETRKTK